MAASKSQINGRGNLDLYFSTDDWNTASEVDLFNPIVNASNFYFQVRSDLINGKSVRLVGFTQIVEKKLPICVIYPNSCEKITHLCHGTGKSQ